MVFCNSLLLLHTSDLKKLLCVMTTIWITFVALKWYHDAIIYDVFWPIVNNAGFWYTCNRCPSNKGHLKPPNKKNIYRKKWLVEKIKKQNWIPKLKLITKSLRQTKVDIRFRFRFKNRFIVQFNDAEASLKNR